MITTLALLLLAVASGSSTSTGFLTEQVDLIELNHFYDPQGRHVYDQVIFYERHAGSGKYHVRAWCLVEDREYLSRRPATDSQTGFYVVYWNDSEHQIQRKIFSKSYRESWTHVDPERLDRKVFDESRRMLLAQGPKRRQQAENQIAKRGEATAEGRLVASKYLPEEESAPLPASPENP